MKKKYLVYAILPVMAFAIIGAVYANSSAAGFGNPMSNLVAAIAQRFNLNVSDVQQVFDEQRAQMAEQRAEQRTQMEARREQTFTARISQAVTDGKLTQEQADKILAKKAEINTQKTNLEGKTKEELRAAMKAQMDSLKQWATDNNIPQEYLSFLGFGMGKGYGGPGFGRPGFDRPSK